MRPKLWNYNLPKYNRLTVLSKDGLCAADKWTVRCDCGNVRSMVAHLVVYGKNQSCGCLHKERAAQRLRGQTHSRHEHGESRKNRWFKHYKINASERKLEFTLSETAFLDLCNKPCYYCAANPEYRAPTNREYGGAFLSGLDRVDNRKGYSEENCVPSCSNCNRMKGDLSHDDFIISCSRVSTIHHVGDVDFDAVYKRLLRALLNSPKSASPRGIYTHEIRSTTYVLLNPDKSRINFETTGIPERQRIYDNYVKNELAWYKDGSLSAVSAPSKFWLNLADSSGNVVSNYGYIVLHDKKYPGNKSGVDYIVEELSADADSRRAVIHYSEPKYLINSRDVPCTLTAQFFVRNNALSVHVYQRSCDIIKGLSYDVPWHAWLLLHVAKKLNLRAGSITHTIGSLHLYTSDALLASKIVEVKRQA